MTERRKAIATTKKSTTTIETITVEYNSKRLERERYERRHKRESTDRKATLSATRTGAGTDRKAANDNGINRDGTIGKGPTFSRAA
jgi:hypothetical protein